MEERTRTYLRGRFRDHYRRVTITPPPAAGEREWGFIPWSDSPGTTMVRHRSLLELGDIERFLVQRRPRHVYFSVGRYDDPGASSMAAKGWRSSDLVFDLDADHLPSVTPAEDSYAEMLAACKDALLRLLELLEDDFGFEDLSVVFSGNRGYHVHVRDESVLPLEREQRREIVDYVRGIGLEFDELVESRSVAEGYGRSSPAQRRSLRTHGGWGRRIHRQFLSYLEAVLELEEDDAIEELQEIDGVGERRAEAILTAASENREAIETGNISAHAAVARLARSFAPRTVEAESAPIDEPVTTDTNRLIRLPGSLHGGSALATRRIDRESIDQFDPLVDAIPETFTDHDIAVSVTDGGEVELGGRTFTVTDGDHSLPEYVAMFLMARGRAEKARE